MTDAPSPGAVSFSRRPQMLPADVRPEWRLAYLILILSHCRGSVASLRQLAFLNQVLLSPRRRARFADIVGGSIQLDESLLKDEPAFLRALRLGIGLGRLAIPREGRVALTPAGRAIAVSLREAAVLEDETAALSATGPITQRLVEGLLR